MSDQDLFYLLALQEVDGIGDINAKKLVSHFGSAEAVFKSKRLELVEGVGTITASKFNDKSVFGKAEKELDFITKNSINACSFRDNNYPDKLKHCIDGPLLLFSTGKINLSKQKIISIVGTRQITPFGADFTRQLIADIAPLNPVIVSGYAYGVDIVAHLSAIENNLQTVAVVAHGLNQVYPRNHHKYVPKIDANGGFFTEFRSTSEPEPENFVKRNRIVAGISEATIVIESAAKGGSLITANLANGYNRDVFAVPGRTTDTFSEGCNNLIKTQKAHLLTSAADLIYMLNWDLETPSRPVQKQLFIDLEPEEQKVYDYLQAKGKESLDIVALDCEMPVFRLSGMLLNMELKGAIRPLPGKLFEAI